MTAATPPDAPESTSSSAVPPKPRRRWPWALAVVCLLPLLLLAALGSEAGLRAALAAAQALSGGAVQVATLDGSLAQAQLALAAQLTQGPRTLDLQAAASGGRSTPTAPLAASSWHAAISQLQARVHDPALGPGAWRIASRSAIALRWAPSQGGQFEASAGTLSVNSPAPSAQALIDWGPLAWRAGELTSTGGITGLPLQ